MAIWKVKRCPRCGGDMFLDKDIYGWYEKCLQCGYCCELRCLEEIRQNPVRKDESPIGTPGREPRGR